MKLYSLRQSERLTGREIRKAYSELRSIANKRIQRMSEQGLGRSAALFPTIKQIEDSEKFSMRSALLDVSAFLRSERTTVSGEKKFLRQFQETMTAQGFGSLVETRSDIYNMIDFMDYLREQYSEKLFDSGDALDVLQQGQRLNIPMDKLKENYDLFAANIEKMEHVRPSAGGREFSQRRINNLINKWS